MFWVLKRTVSNLLIETVLLCTQKLMLSLRNKIFFNYELFTILTDKRNATVKKYCHLLHVANKHELQKLTITRVKSRVILICRFCLPVMLTNIHVYILTAFTILSNLSQILVVAFLLPVCISFG